MTGFNCPYCKEFVDTKALALDIEHYAESHGEDWTGYIDNNYTTITCNSCEEIVDVKADVVIKADVKIIIKN